MSTETRTDEGQPPASCCSSTAQSTCCDTSEKSTCCSPASTAGGGCGCR